ncbi:uncharacterized protein C8A04DRAFT_34047 [Dichotomopilus funicola]|uniref:Rhodopsin domain-containing protein n=1 Tax=Dichotomopilus funicola TaxID=1934379 RepID=A0AAN6V9I7_9PEZI|nr:hypothetical protein C8A04DRAFT_34047 [Dichotomopilus funicola]
MLFFSLTAVALRFYVRIKLLRSVKSEDWTMLASMVAGIAFGVFMVLQEENGLGRHTPPGPSEEYTAYLKWSWIGTLFYNLSLAFTKVSILLLYLRVLTHDYIRKVTWGALGIVVIYNTWAIAMYLTMCVPIQKKWLPEIDGYCHPVTVWWALTYIHIITDFMIFGIPIPVVVGMTIPLRQKLGLLAVFTLGSFVCLISVLRAIWLNELYHPGDKTWGIVTIANWSTAEVNAAIVCGCMPTLRPLLAKVFGPMMDRIKPQENQQTTGDPSNRPRTIGSMSLNIFRLGRGAASRAGRGSVHVESGLSWTQGTTLTVSHRSNFSKTTPGNLDSAVELCSSSSLFAFGATLRTPLPGSQV